MSAIHSDYRSSSSSSSSRDAGPASRQAVCSLAPSVAPSRSLALLSTLACAAITSVAAQEPLPIQDNSFLIEEAYNQEAGVVQHINTLTRPDHGGSWSYSFTQEWPLGGIRHQIGFTLPVLQTDGLGTGVGDVALNYRYQLLGNPEARTVVAPRATLMLPTGRESAGRGTGEVGVQANLPVSYMPFRQVATHWNAGFTAVPGTATEYNLGASAVWLAHPAVNLVFESVWLGNGSDEAVFLNPGVRGALNFDNGLQVVPGIAYTFGVGPSSGDEELFVYLSFEHGFR